LGHLEKEEAAAEVARAAVAGHTAKKVQATAFGSEQDPGGLDPLHKASSRHHAGLAGGGEEAQAHETAHVGCCRG
jgi:hypothetical protein